MKKVIATLPGLLLMPLFCFAAGKHIQLMTEILSWVNLILLITCAISIKQFFFPGESNRTPFQLFNIIFIIVFYAVSLTFLVNNREYYEGFEQLSGWDCIKKIFFERDTSTLKQWFAVLTLIINIIYIVKYGKDEPYAV